MTNRFQFHKVFRHPGGFNDRCKWWDSYRDCANLKTLSVSVSTLPTASISQRSARISRVHVRLNSLIKKASLKSMVETRYIFFSWHNVQSPQIIHLSIRIPLFNVITVEFLGITNYFVRDRVNGNSKSWVAFGSTRLAWIDITFSMLWPRNQCLLNDQNETG